MFGRAWCPVSRRSSSYGDFEKSRFSFDQITQTHGLVHRKINPNGFLGINHVPQSHFLGCGSRFEWSTDPHCDSTVLPGKIRGVPKSRNRAKPMLNTRVITDCIANNIRIHDKWFGCAWGCPRLLQVRGASETLQIVRIFGDLTATASSPDISKLRH